MNHNIKFIHVVLCGLVLFLLFAPAIASAETDTILDCIAKQQQVRGMSYDEAKKYCTTPAETLISIESCVKKYMEVFGVTYDEASKLCAAGQTPANVNAVINRCGEVEKKLNTLMERLRIAQGQDAESIIKDIMALKTQLRTCQAQAPQTTKIVTPGIKNPCDELPMIRDSLAQFERNIITSGSGLKR
ncbi:MAG: hypothetical protein KKG76_06225 [Euryarchaeota archaeon]|nr:hypothetical protein [Euryarchaeota archaeon]